MGVGLLLVALAAVKKSAPPEPTSAGNQVSSQSSSTPADLFAGTNVLALSVEIEKDALEALRRHPRDWTKATVEFAGTVYSDVAVHIKGSQGSLQSIDERPALTLSFNRFVEGRKFHGLRKIHLNNSAEDPSFLMEILCSELCRKAGLPAARSAHAVVSLNGRALGLYVIKEGLTKEFLGQFFSDTSGNLYDGGFRQDINHSLERIGGRGLDDQSDRIALLRAARESDPKRRWERLQKVLDTDRFVTLLAMSTLMWNWDGYPMSRNNYRVYHDPTTGKLVFIPHGLDQMFWEPNGSIFPPLQGLVANAVMNTPQGQQLYLERLTQLHRDVLQVRPLQKRLDELVTLIKPYRKDAARHAAKLRANIAGRWNSVGEQLKSAER